jgi:DNA-binding Lrp family transcriptional regulator
MVSEKELVIVASLRKNARVKLTELSRSTGLAVSTLFDRVHKLRDLGVTRLSALLDFPRLGFGTCATMLFKVVGGKRDKLKGYLLGSVHVNSLARINNGYDFMAECVFRNMRELEEFCEKLERDYGLRGKEVHFVIEELKREGFLSDLAQVKLLVE